MDLTILDDTILVDRFRKGCVDSYEELISRYQVKAHSLATRLTKSTEDAEEVLQDVFVTVYRKIDSFKGESKFSSWLYRITVNAAFMKLRKNKQDKSISLEDALPNYNQVIENPLHTQIATADGYTLNNEVKESLEIAIAKLPDEYRAVFVLRDVDGLSNKEVSTILGLSIPAVKSRLHRSRLMLRKKLKKFYEDYSPEFTPIQGEGEKLRKAA